MADSQDRDVASLEDDIFAVAHNVEVEPAARAAPRIRLGPERAQALADRLWTFAGRDRGAVLAGLAVFVLVDAVMMYGPLMMSRRPSLLPQFITLLVLAFGLGGLLVWRVGGRWRSFGVGMMLGWLLLTLMSVGFLTGLTAPL
ncbi:hypothetical protein [Spirillospora albida]|uniref:hypothetical protein n=1 Tax=Spirillospora albida TaxID=58123 RepID=UPI0004C26060|nr:hypothetical protein [Spirillospora albida]